MDWLCAEVRDKTALELLMEGIREQSREARYKGSHVAEARVYVAPHKGGHRVYFNRHAHDMLRVLQGLAHAPCHEPEEHERAEPMLA
jgi:hypothetical protein